MAETLLRSDLFCNFTLAVLFRLSPPYDFLDDTELVLETLGLDAGKVLDLSLGDDLADDEVETLPPVEVDDTELSLLTDLFTTGAVDMAVVLLDMTVLGC